jgi:AcrR family transcriptional regulator
MDVRNRILAATVAAFQQEGLEGLSMRKIAARVGLTPMALYRHYADKQALIDAVTLHALQAWRGRLAAVKAATDLQWLEAMGEAFLDFALEEPRLFEAAFRLPAGAARRFPEDFTAGRSPPGALIFQRIEAAKQAGLIGDAPTAEIALSIWAMAQGLIDLYRAGRFSGDETAFRALYRMALRRCISAFRPQDHAWTP